MRTVSSNTRVKRSEAPRSTTFQPTMPKLPLRAYSAHDTSVPGSTETSQRTWIDVSVASL